MNSQGERRNRVTPLMKRYTGVRPTQKNHTDSLNAYATYYIVFKNKVRDSIVYRILYISLKPFLKGIFSGNTYRHIVIITKKALKYETFSFLTVSTKRKDPFQYMLQVKSQLSPKEAEEEEGVDNKMNQIAG